MKEITLGTYNDMPIEWLVLEETEEEMILLQKYIFEVRRYDEKSNDYEGSETNTWLNNWYKLRFKGISIDDMYLLSKEEVEKYFVNVNDTIAYLAPDKFAKDCRNSWWLRSPYYDFDNWADYVRSDGCVSYCSVNDTYRGVRAACKISKSQLKSQ